ncbi:MAG TPA: hypothetical protein VFR06_03985 [Gallionellaceae bacterium]|nr:hypothetical protein [Gallionellaceae bacterium]
MHRVYARLPAHFYRISLHTEEDNMTMALVPDQDHAHLIAKLLTENYKLRDGERIIVAPTVVRPAGSLETPQLELSIK